MMVMVVMVTVMVVMVTVKVMMVTVMLVMMVMMTRAVCASYCGRISGRVEVGKWSRPPILLWRAL